MTNTLMTKKLGDAAARRGGTFDGVSPDDKSLAATLELIYLRPLLQALPESHRTAIDVGAHRGDVTAELLGHGFKVLAVEPQAGLADRIEERFAYEKDHGRLHLQRCAASDQNGAADLLVGSASTVSTLESEWTTVAFPEEFKATRKVRVPIRPTGELVARLGWVTLGFAKVDVEGHELSAMRGLFNHPSARAATAKPPAMVMFEASDHFPDRTQGCLELLAAKGYRTFDLFVRWGIDPIGAERFSEPVLPAAWNDCPRKGFYANIIAYHESSPVTPGGLDPVRFLAEYEQFKTLGTRRSA